MTFMLLDTEKVRARLEANSAQATTVAIESAIKSVRARFESVMQTKLGSDDYADVFFVDGDIEMPSRGDVFKLKLKNGFVEEDSLRIFTADSLAGVQSSATELDVAETVIDLEKGWVSIPASSVEDKFVRITYSAGFADADEVPEWLAETAFFYCFKVLTMSVNQEIKAAAVEALKKMDEFNVQVLDSHLRHSSLAVSAM